MSADRIDTRLLDGQAAADVEEAVRLLAAGACVAVPTETVYGLAADARQPEAVKKIFAAKGRPANHPLIVHLPDAQALTEWATEIPDAAWRLAEVFWPGALTLLLPKAEQVSKVVTGGLDSVGVRVPAHPVLLSVLRQLNTGLAAPSANPYKALSPTSAEQVLAGLQGRIAAVLDGGPCALGLESTILDLTQLKAGGAVRILRPGPITREQIERVLGQAVEMPLQHDTVVPGNVDAHYQPRTPLAVCGHDLLMERLRKGMVPRDVRLLLYSQSLLQQAQLQNLQGQVEVLPDTPDAFAAILYHTLFKQDSYQARALWLERPPAGEAWRAVGDRLKRAASQHLG